MKTLHRTLHPELKVLDANKGLVEYVASDETIDSYREIIRASGWRFNRLQKNAPLQADHDYRVEMTLGRLEDFRVEKNRLIETARFAIDVPENDFARKIFAMVVAGYLPAVSVGFMPTRVVSKWDSDTLPYFTALTELGLNKDSNIRAIYLEQEQIELSVVVIGANPNALARAHRDGIIGDADLPLFSPEATKRETDNAANNPADAAASRQRARTAFLVEIQTKIKSL